MRERETEPIQNFADFRLASLIYADGSSVYPKRQKIMYENLLFTIVIEREVVKIENYEHGVYIFNLVYGVDGVKITMTVDEFETSGIVKSSITRIDQTHTLPKKVGRKFYDKILEFIQDMADRNGKEYINIMNYRSAVGKEKWLEIFDPLGNGHVETEEGGDFVRKFCPAKLVEESRG